VSRPARLAGRQRINVSAQQQGILSPAPLGRGFSPMDIGADRASLFEDPPVIMEGGLRFCSGAIYRTLTAAGLTLLLVDKGRGVIHHARVGAGLPARKAP